MATGNYNIQLFRDREYSIRFDKWIARVKDIQAAMLWRFNDEIETSKTFGYFVWDNNLSDLVPFFSREYFADNFTAIIDAFKIAGTYEAYITVIKSAIGADAVISFEVPSESHLIININNPTGVRLWGAYSDNETHDVIPDQIQYPDNVFAFQTSIAPLTVSETTKLIELLTVNGVFVEVNFIIAP